MLSYVMFVWRHAIAAVCLREEVKDIEKEVKEEGEVKMGGVVSGGVETPGTFGSPPVRADTWRNG